MMIPKPTRKPKQKGRVPEPLRKYKAAVKRADDLWREIVRARNRTGRCQRCHTKPEKEAHHLRSRLYKNTRWIIENGVMLCFTCHLDVQSDGELNRALAISTIGEKRWEELVAQSWSPGKVDPVNAILWLEVEHGKL